MSLWFSIYGISCLTLRPDVAASRAGLSLRGSGPDNNVWQGISIRLLITIFKNSSSLYPAARVRNM